jgi:SAM-dependent methyltransferase
MTNIGITPRRRFSGVSRIVEFNWPQYVVGGVCVAVALVCVGLLPLSEWLAALMYLGIGLAAWWLAASLVASWWVYDASPLMRLKWVNEAIADGQRILNVHSGYDDTSETLTLVFPKAELSVLDLFDATRMTEPSIRRARHAYPLFPDTAQGKWNAWPFGNESFDLVLLLLSAHEFRLASERESLFAEAKRVLAPRGKIVVAEHLRNAWNFAAFGPGCMHFWPRGEWLRLASATGLRVVREERITPLVGYFVLEN